MKIKNGPGAGTLLENSIIKNVTGSRFRINNNKFTSSVIEMHSEGARSK
jgi:hypothetical protein